MSAFKIICPDEQMAKIEEHCFSETRIEVGGFLIGKIEGETTTVTQAIAAQHTVGQSTQLTFTHDTWNDIYAQMQKLPADEALIGWYHSHPNFGVFLSEHDQFIQNNFFKNKGQITIVVDPIRGRRGWFRSVDGKIRKYGEEADTMKPRLGVSATNADANMDVVLGTKAPSASNLKIVAISGIMAVISFVAGLLVNNIGRTSEQQKIETTVFSQVQASLGLFGGNSAATSTPGRSSNTRQAQTNTSGGSTEQHAVPSTTTPAGTSTQRPTLLPSDKAGADCLTRGATSSKNPELICGPNLKWKKVKRPSPAPSIAASTNSGSDTSTATTNGRP